MLGLLTKIFIRDRDVKKPSVRRAYAVLCGGLGVALNLLLFAGKLAVGALTRSISLTADAFNNLSDAGSSVITIIGFKLAGKAPDKEHPFGHGRIEYVAGLLVSLAIVVMGVELAVTSVKAIIAPTEIEYSPVAVILLAVSVAVKLYMAFYNKRVGEKIASATLLAARSDSLGDAAATTVVLAGILVSRFTSLQIDGWIGLAVSVFIVVSGVCAGRDTVAPLLGSPPSREFVEELYRIVLSHSPILGVHDLRVHNYGPGRVIVSLHAEVPSDIGLSVVHDVIDNVEYDLSVALDCEAVIHLDPIDAGDERLNSLRESVSDILRGIDARLTVHDFRTVEGREHLNVIFDLVAPADCALSDAGLKELVERRVEALGGEYHCTVKIDKSFQ